MIRPVWLAAVLCAWAPAMVLAQVPSKGPREISSPVNDRFYIRGIYSSASMDLQARQDPTPLQVGTEVDGETDLGFDPKLDLGRMELGFRLRDDHRLRVDYLKLNRSGDRRLTRQIVFDSTTYNVNDRVQSAADLRLLGFTYTWSFLHRERFEAGVGMGLHIFSAEGEGTVQARNIRERGSSGGVLPSLAVDGAWRISRRWSATVRAQILTVEVDDAKGEFVEYHFDAQYRFRNNIAFGIGYTLTSITANSADIDDPGRFKLEASGPEAFFRVSF
jgi:hypothetical protein